MRRQFLASLIGVFAGLFTANKVAKSADSNEMQCSPPQCWDPKSCIDFDMHKWLGLSKRDVKITDFQVQPTTHEWRVYYSVSFRPLRRMTVSEINTACHYRCGLRNGSSQVQS